MKLQDMCRTYNIHFKKTLGQNLLLDDNINRIMVSAAELGPQDDVLEVGAGLGALTKHLVEHAGRVLSIEIDRAFMPCLEDQFRDQANLKLFRGDVLNHVPSKLLDEYLPGWTDYKMVSNVPYYITTPILFHFWEAAASPSVMVAMVQDEVGRRMCAGVDSSEYGALAIAARWYSEVDIVHWVSRNCFRPMPQVDSCVVRLRRRATPLFPGLEPRFLMSLVRAAFAQRRKTLRNSLTKSGAFGVPQELVLKAFETCEIDPQRRPQTLSLDEFAQLALAIRAGMAHAEETSA